MKKSLFLIISLLVIFLGFSLAQSTGDDSIVEKLFTQFQNGAVQKKITCKNLNAAMTSLGNGVRLKLTNDTNNVRLKYIKRNFIEKARTYMNEKLNCTTQGNTLNTASNTTKKKTETKTEHNGFSGTCTLKPENAIINGGLIIPAITDEYLNCMCCHWESTYTLCPNGQQTKRILNCDNCTTPACKTAVGGASNCTSTN